MAGCRCSFRIADRNTNDSIIHIDTWNALKALARRADFLYVADSKLCSHGNLDYLHRAGGRFVTVLPRSRQEDRHFRKWIQTNPPTWELVWDRPHPRRAEGPPDQWYLCRDPIGSMENLADRVGVVDAPDPAPAGPPAEEHHRRD